MSSVHFTQVHYPESDGKLRGESDLHREARIRYLQILKDHFLGQRIYVSGDLRVYYEQGNAKKFVVPDALVVKEISPKCRRIYKTWIERKGPDVVIETTSRKTRKDMEEKLQLYSRLGVKEYFLFHPDEEYFGPPLQGYRLIGETMAPIEADAAGRLESRELGLKLSLEEGEVQFYRLDTGERLLTADERAEAEASRAEREAEVRQGAEAEIARLRAELARRPSG